MIRKQSRAMTVRTKQRRRTQQGCRTCVRLRTRHQLVTMLLFREAASLLPAVYSKSALALAANASTRLLSSSRGALSSKNEPTRGRTAGELGDDAAQSMQGAEGKAARAGANVEEKCVSDSTVLRPG